MLIFLYLRRALVVLAAGIGGPQLPHIKWRATTQIAQSTSEIRRLSSRANGRLLFVNVETVQPMRKPPEIEIAMWIRYRACSVMSAILQAASLKRIGPLVLAHAGGKA